MRRLGTRVSTLGALRLTGQLGTFCHPRRLAHAAPQAAPSAPEPPKAAPSAPVSPKAAPSAPAAPQAAPSAPEPPKAAPSAPEPPKAAPSAPEPPQAAPSAPEPPKAAPSAPAPPKAAPSAPVSPKAAPSAPEPPKAAPSAPEPPKAAPSAPVSPKAAPSAPAALQAAPSAPEPPKAAPSAPAPPKAAPSAPEPPKAAPSAPEPPKAAPSAPEPPKAAPSAPETPKAAPSAPVSPKAAPSAPEPPKAASIAPAAPQAASIAPEPPKAAPSAPETPQAAPSAPEPPKAAPSAPVSPKAASIAPEPPKAAPSAPEPPKAAPSAPAPPKAAPSAPVSPKAAPSAPETPKAAPSAPVSPKAAPSAPEPPKAASIAPAAPQAASIAPEPPKAAPSAPETPQAAPSAPEPPKAAPSAPEPPKAASIAPEPPKAAPSAPEPPKAASIAPETPQAAPSAPEPPKAAPSAPAPPKAAPSAPEPPKAAPSAPEPPKAAPSAPEPPKAAPSAPETPKAAPSAPVSPKAAPSAPEPPKAAPSAPAPPKAAPSAPEPPKAAPSAPEPPKAAPSAPEPPKAAPSAPETPKAAPSAPVSPKAAPSAPEPPKAAPSAPEPPKAASIAPEPPKAAPSAPETPKAAPSAPVSPKAAPSAPEPPKAAPSAPEPPKAASIAPEPPKAAPSAPETPKAAPSAPVSPKAAPSAPEPPKAAPSAPAPPKAAPSAPEPPKAAPSAPEPPKAAPSAPEPPKAAPSAPEPPKAAPSAPAAPKAASGGQRRDLNLRKGDSTGYTSTSGVRVDPRRANQKKDNRSHVQNRHSAFTDAQPRKSPVVADVVSDIGEVKVVFSQPSAPRSPPTPPKVPIAPQAPRSPVPVKAPEPVSIAPKNSAADSTPVIARSKADLTGDDDDDLFFTIAPPTGVSGPERNMPASMSLSMDEEIAKARASRPLKPSPVAAQESEVRLRLNLTAPTDNVVMGEDDGEVIVEATREPIDKESLQPLSEKDAADIDRHEIPEEISEQAASLADVTKKASSESSAEAAIGKETETLSAVEQSPMLLLDDMPPMIKLGDSVGASELPCIQVRYDSTEVRRVATIELQESPRTLSIAVQVLHEALTTIECEPTVTHVVLTTLPSVNFFEPLQCLAGMPAAARLEAHRSKDNLLRRIAAAAPRLCIVAIAHGGAVRDFGADLFLACHRRVLLDPSSATFGFPSIARGEYPAVATTQRLAEWIGASRTVEIAPRLHEFSAESLVTMGLTGTASHAHEAFARLTATPNQSGGSGSRAAVSDNTHSDGAHAPVTPMRWALRVIHFCMARSPSRVRLLRWMLFRRGFDFAPADRNPLLQGWTRYAVMALTADGEGCDAVLSETLYSVAAANVSRVCAAESEMLRRPQLPLPVGECVAFRGSEINIWPDKAKALAATRAQLNVHCEKEKSYDYADGSDSRRTVFLDASPRFIDATCRFLESHRTGAFNDFRDVNIVLLGPAGDALASSFPCAAVVSNVSPLRDCALQEVRLFARGDCPPLRRRETLCATLNFLYRERRPTVLCRGKCGERLLAALVDEAFRATWDSGDAQCVERAAVDLLGLSVAPLRLVDHIGVRSVLRMLEKDGAKDFVPPVARLALRDMCADGLFGRGAPRGGFYTYDNTISSNNNSNNNNNNNSNNSNGPQLRADVMRRYIHRRGTDADIADRLLSAVVNACCELLMDGRLCSAADANALTIAVLGFRETTGGALALADAYGVEAFVRRMDELAEWHGPQLRPSPLLRCMAHAKVSFGSLSEAVIQSARS